MLIVGFLGMPKAGKGFVELELRRAYRTLSMEMSDRLKDFLIDKKRMPTDKVTRDLMFTRGGQFIREYGRDLLAKEALQYIEENKKPDTEIFIINGIRRPEEMETIVKSGHQVLMVGVVADKDQEKDREIRKERLRKDVENGTRGEGFETLEEFDETDRLEWNNPDPDSTQVGACFQYLGELQQQRKGLIYVNPDRDSGVPREDIREVIRPYLEAPVKDPERK